LTERSDRWAITEHNLGTQAATVGAAQILPEPMLSDAQVRS